MDPYLEHLKKKADANAKALGMLLPGQLVEPGTFNGQPQQTWCGTDFTPTMSGLLLPGAKPPAEFGFANYAMQYSPVDKKSLLAAFKKLVCQPPEEEPEQEHILRAHHNRRYEYVWSETLQAHVRIGLDLKAPAPA